MNGPGAAAPGTSQSRPGGRAEKPRHKSRRPLLVRTGAFLASLAVVGGGVAISETANAADQAAGFGGYNESFGGYIGSLVLPDGSLGYCIHPASGDGTGSTSAGVVGGYVDYNGNPLSATALQQLNYVFATYGQQHDATIDQAVSLFSYAWTGSYDAGHPIGSLQLGAKYLAAGNQAILDEYTTIWNFAQNTAHYGGTTTGNGKLTFAVDGTDNYHGTVTMVGTAGSTGSETLTNGVFTDSTFTQNLGTTATGVVEGKALYVKGVPPKSDGSPYKISGAGSFLAPGTGGYAATITVYQTGGGQDLGSAGTKTQNAPFAVSGSDPQFRSVTFQPAATTKVGATYVTTGGDLVDVVQPKTVADSTGTNNPFAQRANGDYYQVVYKGTAYGPLTTKPAAGALAPAGTPVAGTATFTTDVTAGPTKSYTATIAGGVKGSGYYTWVWSVSYADQPAGTQYYIPGPNSSPAASPYSWSDSYGQVVESSIVPPTVTTTAKSLQAVGLPISDTAHVAGVVTADEGFTVGFQYYTQKSKIDASGMPSLDGTAVCDASTLTYTSAPTAITKPGDVVSGSFTPTQAGVGAWVETLYGPGGVVVSAGKCGESSEMTVVKQLIITTQTSTQAAHSGDSLTDIAKVSGTIPNGAQLTWTLYQQAGSAASTSDTAVCTTKPLGITPGVVNGVVYTSPSCTVPSAGKYYWVETATDVTGKVISVGGRGVSSESTTAIDTPKPAGLPIVAG